MSVTISPTAATINGASKPYLAQFTAVVDFQPFRYYWYVNGARVYSGVTYTNLGGGNYRIDGPTRQISAAPITIRAAVIDASDGSSEQAEFTTADQRTAATTSLSLLSQKDGVPIVDGESVPMTPVAAAVPGQSQIDFRWSKGAAGESPISRVVVRVAMHNEANNIDEFQVNWGDGNVETHDVPNLNRITRDLHHTYTGVTGLYTMQVNPSEAGTGSGPSASLAVQISADATGWYAQQYRIEERRNQPGFRQISQVGWRDISDSTGTFTMYSKRSGFSYYHSLQLREVDVTGRPIRTSAISGEVNTGPW